MVKKLKIKNSTLQSRQVESTVLRKFHYFKLFFFWFCFNIEHIRHALTTSTSTPFSCISSPWNHQIFSTNPVKSGPKEVLFKWATTQLRVVIIIIIIIIVHLQNTGEVIVFAACGEGTHMLGWEGFHHGTTNSSNKKAFRNTPVFLKSFFEGGFVFTPSRGIWFLPRRGTEVKIFGIACVRNPMNRRLNLWCFFLKSSQLRFITSFWGTGDFRSLSQSSDEENTTRSEATWQPRKTWLQFFSVFLEQRSSNCEPPPAEEGDRWGKDTERGRVRAGS